MNFQNKNDLIQYLQRCYDQIGAFDADIVYIYSDLRFFGQFINLFQSKNDLCSSLISPLIARDKTIIIATFTYTTSGVFNTESTQTNLGVLNKWILSQDNFARSEHPIFSYAAIGPNRNVIKNVGKAAFGKNSVFEKLLGKKCGFLHIGRPVELGNTAIHYVEQVCGATYRYSKCYDTKVYSSGEYLGTDYSSFVRKLDIPGENFFFDFRKATSLMQNKGLIAEIGSTLDLSNISFYWYDDSINFLVEEFYKNQCIFINSNYKNYE